MGHRRHADLRAAIDAAADRRRDGQRAGRVLALAGGRNRLDRWHQASMASRFRQTRIRKREAVSMQFKTANRELDPQRLDFRWIPDDAISGWPIREVLVLERLENGNFFGLLERVEAAGLDVPAGGTAIEQFEAALDARAARTHRTTSSRSRHRSESLNRELQDVQESLLLLHYRRKQAIERGGGRAGLG